jgi:hypothetical protein
MMIERITFVELEEKKFGNKYVYIVHRASYPARAERNSTTVQLLTNRKSVPSYGYHQSLRHNMTN